MWLGSSCFTLPRLWLSGSSCQTAVGASGKVRATLLPELRLMEYIQHEITQIRRTQQPNKKHKKQETNMTQTQTQAVGLRQSESHYAPGAPFDQIS